MKRYVSIPICFAIFMVISAPAVAEDWSRRLYDSVYKDKNYRVVVDIDSIKHSLSNGANPNAIFTQGTFSESILGKYVYTMGGNTYGEDRPEIDKKGAQALALLFQNGAKFQQNYDSTILFRAVSAGYHDIVKILLQHGADPKSWNYSKIGGPHYRCSPVEEAVRQGNDRIVNLLVDFGAQRPGGREAAQIRFVYLALFGNARDLREQLAKGAAVNQPDCKGGLALLNALSILEPDSSRKYSNVMLLLSEGADVNLSGVHMGSKTSPLHTAVHYTSYGFSSTAKRDRSHEEQLLQQLIKRGAHVSGTDETGKTPLHIAARFNNIYAAKLLYDAGAKVTATDRSGKTPLDYARSPEMTRLLMDFAAQKK